MFIGPLQFYDKKQRTIVHIIEPTLGSFAFCLIHFRVGESSEGGTVIYAETRPDPLHMVFTSCSRQCILSRLLAFAKIVSALDEVGREWDEAF